MADLEQIGDQRVLVAELERVGVAQLLHARQVVALVAQRGGKRLEVPIDHLGAHARMGEQIERAVARQQRRLGHERHPFGGERVGKLDDDLVERIRAVLQPERTWRAGDLTIDVVARVASIRGIPLKLSHKEFQLLAKLGSDPSRLFTRAELLRDIWHWPPSMHTRTLDSHASRLRCKLRAVDPVTPYVDNEWGVGYRLIGPYPSIG